MQEVGAFEAKNTFSALLDRVEHGEEIMITRRGKAVAKLTATGLGFDREKALQAAARILNRAAELKMGKFDWTEWKAYRDEGRK